MSNRKWSFGDNPVTAVFAIAGCAVGIVAFLFMEMFCPKATMMPRRTRRS